MLKVIIIIILTITVLLAGNLQARIISINGQLSGWYTLRDSTLDDIHAGLRYIPELRLSGVLSQGKDIDAEIGVNWQSYEEDNPKLKRTAFGLVIHLFNLRYVPACKR